MVQAYMLIQTEVGKAAGVTDAIRGVTGVTSTAEVTGPYDIISQVEADSIEALGKQVIAKIQEIPGITRTTTCTVVQL